MPACTMRGEGLSSLMGRGGRGRGPVPIEPCRRVLFAGGMGGRALLLSVGVDGSGCCE